MVDEWPRARVTLAEGTRKARILGLPDGERVRMRPAHPLTRSRGSARHAAAEPAFLADDDGLERVEPHGGGTRLTWDSLRQVTLVRATSQDWETVLFTGVDGDLQVPFDAMHEAIWERVRRLPGANAAVVDSAIASAVPRDRLVWWQGMDTGPDFVV